MTTVRTPTGERIRLGQRAVAELGMTLRGELVGPADRGYETHRRVWNGSIDRHPALIVRCAGVADVIDAVRFARQVGLPVAVRSGGHSFPGLSVCDDGLVIDLSLMKGVRVDLASRTVRAQAVRLGELDRETQAFGLAVPAGIVTHTGLAGLTLGGGIGWLMRKYGLTIDQLRSVDLVTADEELVKASAQENSDLFWGVREAGGTSASSPSSSSSSTPSVPRSSPDRSSGRWSSRRRCCASTATGSPTCRTSSPRSSCTARRRPAVLPPGCTADPSSRLSAATPDRAGGERAGRPAAQGLRPPLIDLCTRTPLRQAPGDVRRLVPGGLVVLLPVLRRRHSDRRGHRHHRRARPTHPLPADGIPDLPPWEARSGASATTRPPSTGEPPATPSTSTPPPRPGTGSRRSASGHAASGRPSSPTTPASTSTS